MLLMAVPEALEKECRKILVDEGVVLVRRVQTLVFVFMVMLLISSCTKTHTVNITFVPDGGQLALDVPIQNQKTTAQVNSNSPQWHPPTPFKLGFTFVNWYLDSNFGALYTPDALKANTELTLYARYVDSSQEGVFVVSFVSYGGTFTPSQLVEAGGLITEPKPPILAGHTFQYWVYEVSASGKSGRVDFSQPVDENLVLGAEYRKN